MLATLTPKINPAEFSRCEESSQMADRGKALSPSQKADATIKESVEHAFWQDDVLQAIEYDQIDIHVKNGVVYLYGHITGANSQSRIGNVIRGIRGILRIQNNLVLDDKLTLNVAGSLGELEHIHDCKFFTGASHGVISLNGNVRDENVKLLAEQTASSNPNVRGVINNVHVAGAEQDFQAQPFLQPTIGEMIYFLDGVSGVVKQVIINPNNRRVVAMAILGQFADQRQDLKSLNSAEARSPERLVVLPMDVIRYMTKVSAFLYINSYERERYVAFDPIHFSTPKSDWKAPYPYCADDVLFPVEKRNAEDPTLQALPRSPVELKEQLLWEQLLADENLGG